MAFLGWVLFKLPVAVFLFLTGLALCCTLVLLPIGSALVDSAVEVLF